MNIFADNAIGHVLISRIIPYLNKNGYNLTEKNNGCDRHLAFVRFGINTKIPKILRLDGIYYDSDTPFQNRNSAISSSHSIADGIIYQSEYSKRLCEALLSKRKKSTKTYVIYNGIEPNWCGNPVEHDGVNIVVTSKWRRHKRLKETIELFLEFNKIVPNSKLHIFGRLHDNKEVKHPNIKYYGQVDRNKFIDIFRIGDMAIHLSKRDSCPNSVVEYISAGIPVITTNNCGGSTEMCKITNGCIIVDGDGSYDDLSPVPHYGEKWNILSENVRIDLLEAMKKIAEDKRRVILPYELTAEYSAKKYIDAIELR